MNPEKVGEQLQAVTTARWILTILRGLGVTDFVYCPGSRCAPFAYALTEMEEAGQSVRIHTKIDERSAAFYALGLSRGTTGYTSLPAPVALIMTSGTAVGHALPAVMEAHHSNLPLIVVSADRPWEMREVGASQTSRQAGIFANFVRRTLELPADLHLPNLQSVETNDPEIAHFRAQEALQTKGVRQLRNQLRHLAYAWQANNPQRGPVHLNVGLRDPLVPNSMGDQIAWSEVQYALHDDAGLYAQTVSRKNPVDDETLHYFLEDSPSIIVVGASAPEIPTATWHKWAENGYIILAEPGTKPFSLGIATPYQQQLVTQLGVEAEQVIVLGQPTLSRPLLKLVNSPEHEVIIISDQPDYPDLSANACLILPTLTELPKQAERGREFAGKWAKAARELEASYKHLELPDGIIATRITWDTLGENDLIVGASNPVRYLDLIADTRTPHGQVYTNRGQAGIDGTIAFARGLYANRYEHSEGATLERMRVLLGDLTFLHDASSLLNGSGEIVPNLDIIVLDDQGGRIFASLEHGEAASPELYERFFAMGQAVDYQALAAAYGWEYQLITGLQTPEKQAELTRILTVPARGGRIIHIRCDHTQIRAQIKSLFI